MLATVTYFISFHLLWSFMAVPYLYAISIAYVLSVITHFIANRHITFQDRNKEKLFLEIRKYFVVVIGNYFFNVSVVYVTVDLLELSPYIGILSAIAIVTVFSYLAAHFWIFKESKE